IDLINDAIDKNLKIAELAREFLQKSTAAFGYLLAAGEFLYVKGMYSEGEILYDIARRMRPNNVTVLTQLAKIYHQTERSEKAYEILKNAKALSPQNIERLCLLGEMGLSLRQPEEARSFFRDALALDRESTKAA